MADWVEERAADIAVRLKSGVPEFEQRVFAAHTRIIDEEEEPTPFAIVDVPSFRRARRDATAPSFRTLVDIKIAIVVSTVATDRPAGDQERLKGTINAMRAAVENTLFEDADWVRQWESFEDGDWDTVPLPAGRRLLLAGVLSITAVQNEDFAPRLPHGLAGVDVRRPGNTDALGVEDDRAQKIDLPTARDGQAELEGSGAVAADPE